MERVTDTADGMVREQATLVAIQFTDPSGPWSICTFKREDGTVFNGTGSFGNAVLYEDFILYGKWSPDIPGGDFDTSMFNSMPPKSMESMASYLSTLTRVSRASTNKAVQHFGENLLDILEKAPGRLVEAGLSEAEAQRLGTTWAEQRSEQLALAQIDLEGIPPAKLSTLQRRLGYSVDLSQVLREDPYLLYVHFDDMLFTTAQSLAKRFRVRNDSLSAVKGAIVAILRREAWLGHSYIAGSPLMEAVCRLLGITRDQLRPLIADAVTELSKAKVAHAEDKKLQLYNLYEIEKSLVQKTIEWVELNADELGDIVPSEEMALKLLKPMNMGVPATRQLAGGLCSLLAERLALIQCETLHDQLAIVRGIYLILKAFGTDVVFTANTLEMVEELKKTVGQEASAVGYAELIGIDPDTGVPFNNKSSPISADVVVFVGADALGIEETNFVLEAMPANGRIFFLGIPKDLPAQTVGQPFDELAEVKQIRKFLGSFWMPTGSEHRQAANMVWSGAIQPNATFDPAQPISWIKAPRESLPEALNLVIKLFSEECELDPLHDIKTVVVKQQADVPTGDAVTWLTKAIAKEFVGQDEPVEFHGKELFKGLPVVVRQPVSRIHPAFSVFTATELNQQRMVASPRTGHPIELDLKRNLNLFHGAVMTPKFIRGRVYEIVVLVVLQEHLKLINAELLSTLLNSTKRTLVLVGEIDGIVEHFPGSEPTRVRSTLPKWMAQNGDQIVSA
ncbi:helix-hairpin-helix domain-containing protein [Pseudomonas frederiksbergensis]